MYKDNGSVDVELLAEVGYIAHSVRNLDEKLSTLAPNPLDANTINVICPDATGNNQCHHQSAQSSNESSELKAPSNLQNIIIDFYEKHQEFHLEKERAVVEKYFRGKPHSKLYKLTSGQDTMNNSNPNRNSSNVSDSSALNLIGEENIDNIEIDNLAPSRSNDATVSCLQRNSVGRGSISQPMPEIQISNSEDTNGATAAAISTGLDQQHKEQVTPSSPLRSIAFGSGSGGICGHYCSGWQSAICTEQLSDEDLKNLVIELKNKVEFTERMNWLCKLFIFNQIFIHILLFSFIYLNQFLLVFFQQ